MATPVIVQKSPYGQAVEAGKTYYWCACGLSTNQPFCSGAHKDTGIAPIAFVAETTSTVWLCGCKQTKSPPFCDGSHQSLNRDRQLG